MISICNPIPTPQPDIVTAVLAGATVAATTIAHI